MALQHDTQDRSQGAAGMSTPSDNRDDSIRKMLDERFSKMSDEIASSITERFGDLESHINERFTSFETNIDARFEKFQEHMDKRFDDRDEYYTKRDHELRYEIKQIAGKQDQILDRLDKR